MIEIVVGIAGFFFLLSAFYLDHIKKYHREGYVYNCLNLIGALLLAYYAYSVNAQIFIALQLVWALIALYFLVKLNRSKHKKQ